MDDFQQPLQEASNLAPMAAGMLVVLVGLIWGLPRRMALWPLLIMTCIMPLGQQVVVLGLNFHLFRILILAGLIRVFIRGELRLLSLGNMDKVFLGWALVGVVLGSLSNPSTGLLINRLGQAYNALGCYCFMRCVMIDTEDVVAALQAIAWLVIPIAGLMIIEKMTGRNLLSIFGGVPEFTGIRDGRLRCQGAFRHPILAGTFGATQLPLLVGLWAFRPDLRRLVSVSLVACLIIVGTASSSGALMACLAGIVGLLCWRFRYRMRTLRWTVVGAVVLLAMVMNAPVWYLFARLSSITGGTGWHRAYLIDQAIQHFSEWWLCGTTYTAHWAPGGEVIAGDHQMMDITNHFVAQAVTGGLLMLVLFVVLIIIGFRTVGRWVHSLPEGQNSRFLVWAVGVSLFTHCLSFMSATYFDQTVVVWYWLLAALACFSSLLPVPILAEEDLESGETTSEG